MSIDQHAESHGQRCTDADATFREDFLQVVASIGLDPDEALRWSRPPAAGRSTPARQRELLPVLGELLALAQRARTRVDTGSACGAEHESGSRRARARDRHAAHQRRPVELRRAPVRRRWCSRGDATPRAGVAGDRRRRRAAPLPGAHRPAPRRCGASPASSAPPIRRRFCVRSNRRRSRPAIPLRSDPTSRSPRPRSSCAPATTCHCAPSTTASSTPRRLRSGRSAARHPRRAGRSARRLARRLPAGRPGAGPARLGARLPAPGARAAAGPGAARRHRPIPGGSAGAARAHRARTWSGSSVSDAWSRGDWLPGLELVVGSAGRSSSAASSSSAGCGRASWSTRSWSRPSSAATPASVELRLAVIAPGFADPDAVQARLDRLVAAYRPFTLATGNCLVPRPLRRDADDLRVLAPLDRPNLLNVRELAGLWHLPQAGDDVVFVERTTARRRLPLPAHRRSGRRRDGCRIGVSPTRATPCRCTCRPACCAAICWPWPRRAAASRACCCAWSHHLMRLRRRRRIARVVLVDPHRDLAVSALGLVPAHAPGRRRLPGRLQPAPAVRHQSAGHRPGLGSRPGHRQRAAHLPPRVRRLLGTAHGGRLPLRRPGAVRSQRGTVRRRPARRPRRPAHHPGRAGACSSGPASAARS